MIFWNTPARWLMMGFLVILGTYFITKLTVIRDNISTTDTHSINIGKDIVKQQICSECYEYDLTVNGSGYDYPCVQMKLKPSTPICLYPKERDVWVSGAYWKNQIWEGGLLNALKKKILKYPDMGFIDLGANIGSFTLPIAAMGRQVLAVDANIENVRRLHKAISLGKLADKVTLLVNAVTNMRGVSRIVHNQKNQGGIPVKQVNIESGKDYNQENYTKSILMDDLLPFCKFKQAIMKVDIEGSESKAFTHAGSLLDNIDILYIQMEWHVAHILKNNIKGTEYEMISSMADFFALRGYSSKTINDERLLNRKNWQEWPKDILWVKDGY